MEAFSRQEEEEKQEVWGGGKAATVLQEPSGDATLDRG